MGTSLGPKYIPYSYMDPLGSMHSESMQCSHNIGFRDIGGSDGHGNGE